MLTERDWACFPFKHGDHPGVGRPAALGYLMIEVVRFGVTHSAESTRLLSRLQLSAFTEVWEDGFGPLHDHVDRSLVVGDLSEPMAIRKVERDLFQCRSAELLGRSRDYENQDSS